MAPFPDPLFETLKRFVRLQNQSGEDDPLDKIDEYRRLPTACLELARVCTVDKDRAALLQMTLTLSRLANRAVAGNKPDKRLAASVGASFFEPLLR